METKTGGLWPPVSCLQEYLALDNKSQAGVILITD
jgi:hypothetical protein